jgi:predicted AAA+ superfamily ATPase
MQKNNSVLIEYFGDNPVIRITDFLIENKIFDYSKKQIMEETGISKATLFKYFGKLEKVGIVKATRRFGKTTLYKINEENPVVKKIIALGLELANQEALRLPQKRTMIKSSK